MVEHIRAKDQELVSILKNGLKEHTQCPISEDAIKVALGKVIHHIRQTSRRVENIVWINKEYMWDRTNESLYYNSQEIHLTKRERELISLLATDTKKTFPYDEIFYHIWGDYETSRQDSLKTLVKQLRKKLPRNMIKNVFGYGYKLI